jgi:hypothetical protein
MPGPHALLTLLVNNGEDAYAFVGMVSFGEKSSGACRRRSTRSTTTDEDVEVGPAVNAAVVVERDVTMATVVNIRVREHVSGGCVGRGSGSCGA